MKGEGKGVVVSTHYSNTSIYIPNTHRPPRLRSIMEIGG